MYELNQLLYNAKESFLDPRTTRALIDHIGRILENVFWSLRQHTVLFALYFTIFPSQQPLSTDGSESVNDSLLLIRNILHVPERPASSPFAQNYESECSQQNRVVWNLFVQGFDRLLINLLACPQKVLDINIDSIALRLFIYLTIFYYTERLGKDNSTADCSPV